MDELNVDTDADTGHGTRPAGTATDPATDASALTYREYQVLQHLAHGRTNAEIGERLGLSEDTVKTHLRSMFRALGARDRTHAVALGYQRGLLGAGGSVPNGPGLTPYVMFVASDVDAGRDCPADPEHSAAPLCQDCPVGVDEVDRFMRAMGLALRTVRQRYDWTLKETGVPVGISVSVLCRVERAERPLDLEKLISLCVRLGVAPVDLVWFAQDTAYPRGWPHQLTSEPVIPSFSEHRKCTHG